MNFIFRKQPASTSYNLLWAASRITSLFISFLFGMLLITHIKATYAQNEPSTSYKIKAGFLLQLTSYVTWPSVNTNNNHVNHNKYNIEICIVGHDPFGQFIDDMITARPTNNKGHPIRIRRIKTQKNLTDCHVIFITERSIDYTFWQSLSPNHTHLLVSEYNGFLQQGGMISFKKNKNHIQININIQNSNNKKIVISPELLRVSTIITTQEPKE